MYDIHILISAGSRAITIASEISNGLSNYSPGEKIRYFPRHRG